MPAWTLVAALVLAGLGCVAAGLGRARFRLAPVIANVVIVACYFAIVLAVGIWANRCWDCSVGGYEDSRGFSYFLAVVFLGFLAIIGVALTWLAALASVLVWPGQPPLGGRMIVLGWTLLIVAVLFLANIRAA